MIKLHIVGVLTNTDTILSADLTTWVNPDAILMIDEYKDKTTVTVAGGAVMIVDAVASELAQAVASMRSRLADEVQALHIALRKATA